MQVVNKRTHKPTPRDVYIGRPSVLGNPYSIRIDGTRNEVVAMYRDWLWEQIVHSNPAVMQALQALREDSVLVCWCAPRLCHGLVIAEAWRELRPRPETAIAGGGAAW